MSADAEVLFAEHQERLFRYLCRATGQADAARDLTQDVFLRVSRTPVPVASRPEVQAWLFRIARNLVIDYHRRRHRLVATDLWLIDRASDGSERSQTLSLRGRVNEKTPFYFETVVDSGTTLDLYGALVVMPASGALRVKLQTRSRVTVNGQSSTILRDAKMMRAREVESDIRMKPGEVVAVELPRLSENEAGAFANRTFSIRVRTRQIR